MVLNEKNDYIYIPLVDGTLEGDGALRWKIELRFQTYLADVRDNPISAETVIDKCYSGSARTTVMKLVGVCDFNNRPIEYVGVVSAKCLYNDAEKLLNLEINGTYEDDAEIRISDIGGKLEKMQKIHINKGINRISVGLDELPCGTYALQVIGSEHTILNKLFIKY